MHLSVQINACNLVGMWGVFSACIAIVTYYYLELAYDFHVISTAIATLFTLYSRHGRSHC